MEREVLFGAITLDDKEASSLLILRVESNSEVLDILELFLTLLVVLQQFEELIKKMVPGFCLALQ